jgi:hypothetical protein
LIFGVNLVFYGKGGDLFQMNKICDEILAKKQREGKDVNKARLDNLVAKIVEFSNITEDNAWKLIQRLDSIESITQEQINEICKEFKVTFKKANEHFALPRFVPVLKSGVYAFNFILLLGAPRIH